MVLCICLSYAEGVTVNSGAVCQNCSAMFMSSAAASSRSKCKVLAVIAMCLLAAAAHAQSKNDTDWATNNLSGEMIECGQYFLISWACLREFPSPQAESVASDYRRASDEISQLAFQVGRLVGLSEEAAAARMRLVNDNLSREISNNCTNISILQERYAAFCKNLTQHPDERFKELVQCSMEKKAFPCGEH
jgi:hypothetical protein